MIATDTDTGELTIQEAALKLKRSTIGIRKWINNGLKSSDGTRIRLKARKLGRTWLIDPADLDEFSRRLTEAALAK